MPRSQPLLGKYFSALSEEMLPFARCFTVLLLCVSSRALGKRRVYTAGHCPPCPCSGFTSQKSPFKADPVHQLLPHTSDSEHPENHYLSITSAPSTSTSLLKVVPLRESCQAAFISSRFFLLKPPSKSSQVSLTLTFLGLMVAGSTVPSKRPS